MKQAFSLVELSIVLVILGLLTGGILTGQNLIRAAELRSVTADFQRYQTAVQTFRDKYFALPGDIRNATDFWGSAGGSGVIGDGCEAATGTGTETCNGDGGGLVNSAPGASEYGERFTFWQHMANAGLIEGTYTGRAEAANEFSALPGVNVPQSKISGATFYVSSDVGTNTAVDNYYNGSYGHAFRYGGFNGTQGFGGAGHVLSAEESWNIDTKVDDGRPGYGFMVVMSDDADCVAPTGDANIATAAYALSSTATACAPIFRNLF